MASSLNCFLSRRTRKSNVTIASLTLLAVTLFFLSKTLPRHDWRWPPLPSTSNGVLTFRLSRHPAFSNVTQDVNHHSQSVEVVLGRVKPYLQAWLDRPITSYTQALFTNQLACGPDRELQSNPDQLRNSADAWIKIEPAAIANIRSEVVASILDFFQDTINPPTDSWSQSHLRLRAMHGQPLLGNGTRGIVITGGNTDTMSRLMVMVRILRRTHQCRMPIEIFLFPDETHRAAQFEAELSALGGIELRSLPYKKNPRAWKNFHIKGASIIHSSFTQLLYLDSDNIPLTDPTFLFESPVFKEWGIVLWPDITKDGAKNPIWRLAGQTCIPQDWQIDSGQILLDKSAQRGLVFGAFLVAAQMQLNHEFWFRISEGDKDTFRYALYALQLPWTRAPHWLSSAGAYNPDSKYCGHTMFQYSLSPADWNTAYPRFSKIALSRAQQQHAPPLFAHINLLKHNPGFPRRKTFSVLHRLAPSDLVARSNLNISDLVRTKVSSKHGLCVYYSIRDQPTSQSVRTDNPGEDSPQGWVLEEPWNVAWGGLLRDFESVYWDNGGL